MAPPDVAAGGDDAGPTQRELLMELREHIEGLKATVDAIAKDQALGVTDFTFTLTAHARARGWDAAFGAGVVSVKEGRSGRGERICPATIDLPVTMRLAEPPEPCEWLRSA